jgi:hypothetical protein
MESEEMKIPRYCISLTVTDNDTGKHFEEGCNVENMLMVESVIEKFKNDIKKKL